MDVNDLVYKYSLIIQLLLENSVTTAEHVGESKA